MNLNKRDTLWHSSRLSKPFSNCKRLHTITIENWTRICTFVGTAIKITNKNDFGKKHNNDQNGIRSNWSEEMSWNMNAYNKIQKPFNIYSTAICQQFGAFQKSFVCLLHQVMCTKHLFLLFSSPNSSVYCKFHQNIFQMFLDDRL